MPRLVLCAGLLALGLVCHAPHGAALELVLQAPLPVIEVSQRAAQSGNGRFLALYEDKTVQVIDLATALVVAEFTGFEYLKFAALDWTGEKVAVAAGDNVREYDIRSRKLLRELAQPLCGRFVRRAAEFDAMAYARSGTLVATWLGCAAAWRAGDTRARVTEIPELSRTLSLEAAGERLLAMVSVRAPDDAGEKQRHRAVVSIDPDAESPRLTSLVSTFAGNFVGRMAADGGARFAVLSKRGGKDAVLEIYALDSDHSARLERTVSSLQWGAKLNGWHGSEVVLTLNDGVYRVPAATGVPAQVSTREDSGVIYHRRLWSPRMHVGERSGLGYLELAASPGRGAKDARRVLALESVPILNRGCYDAARHQAVFITEDRHMQMIDLETGQPLRQYPRRNAGEACAISSDGRWLVTWAPGGGSAMLYDHAQGRAITQARIDGRPGFRLRDEAPYMLEFPDMAPREFTFDASDAAAPALLIADTDGDVVRWEWGSGNVRMYSAPWNNRHRAIRHALRASHNELWLGAENGELHVFDLKNDTKPRYIVAAPISSDRNAPLTLAFNEEESMLAAGYLRGLVLIDARSGKPARTLLDDKHPHATFRDYSRGAAWIANGELLLLRGPDTFSALDLKTGTLVSEPLPRSVSSIFGGHPRRAIGVISSTATGVRLWDARAARYLGELLGANEAGSFLAVTHEGFFAGAGADVRRVAFRDGERMVPAEQAFEAFYRPDIVQEVFSGVATGARTIDAAQTLAEALRDPAPAVELTARRAAHNGAPGIELQARIRDTGGGVGEVRLFRNGKLVARWNKAARNEAPAHAAHAAAPGAVRGLIAIAVSAAPASTTAANTFARPSAATRTDWPADGKIRVPFHPGEAVFSLVAYNARGTLQSLPGVAEQPESAASPRPPRALVLAVGINEYRLPRAALNHAEQDARDAGALFATALRSQLAAAATSPFATTTSVDPAAVQIITLLSKDATRTRLLQQLAALETQLLPQDRLVVFFAGHGVMTPQGYAFVTHEYDGTLGPDSTITGQQLTDALARIPAESQLLVLDTCHAGGMDTMLRGLYDARASALAARTGVRLLASATSLQEALDGYKGNGLFTHTMLEALASRSTDLNEDSVISMGELGIRLRARVPQLARSVGHRQEPTLFLGNLRELVQQLPRADAAAASK